MDGRQGRAVKLQKMQKPIARDQTKWLVLSFAFLATVINYLDRQTLSVMAPVLLEQFHISAERYSYIVSAFMLAYTVANGVSGRLLDRLGTKTGYALTIAWWSAAETLCALSTGALSLGIFRFLLGMGEAGNYPAGVKLVAEWFPAEERSLASGVFNSGSSVGAILAPPLLALILLTAGWRTAFLSVGFLGFIWLAAWLRFYPGVKAVGAACRDRPSTAKDPTAIEVSLAVHSIQGLQRSRLVLLYFLGPTILEGCPRLLHETDRRDGLDTLPYRRHRQPGRRSRIHRAAAVRPNNSHHTPPRHSYLFSVDDFCRLRGRKQECRRVHRADIGGNLRLYRSTRKPARRSWRCLSQRSGGLHLGLRQHGSWLWRHDLQPGDRLAGAAILLSADVRTLRNHSIDFRMAGLDAARKPKNSHPATP